MTSERKTRRCLDPWRYVEIGAFGEVSPCCVYPPLGHIDAASASGMVDRDCDPFRHLRAREANLEPEWVISCSVYNKSVPSLCDLAWFVVTAGFDSVTFWKLVKYPDVLDPGTMCVKPITDLLDDERRKAVAVLRDAIRILEDHDVNADVADDFVDWPSGSWSRTS